jgi:hypothetical protein
MGFQRRNQQILTLALDGDALGWLGLNAATRHLPRSQAEIFPVVGVRHQTVERLVADCRGVPFHPFIPPTVSTPLAYLLPDPRYRTWLFAGEDEAVAQQLGELVKKYAVPFMVAAAPLSNLVEELKQGSGIASQAAFRRPVALMLAGEITEAQRDVQASVQRLANRTDDAALAFRDFARVLLARLASQARGSP